MCLPRPIRKPWTARSSRKLVNSADRKDFARNALVLIVPADSKLKLQQLSDLQQPAIKHVALGVPASVPVGRYAKHALENARLWPAVEAKAINTQNVRQSLDYVARGEVEAGFVYQTDAAIMPDKVKVAFACRWMKPSATRWHAPPRSQCRRGAALCHLPAVTGRPGHSGRYGFHKP
jgi:molybdate transport system substrate-binding protein